MPVFLPFTLQILVAGYFLWLGLFLISRAYLLPAVRPSAWWTQPDVSAGLAVVLVFIFLCGVALEGVSRTPEEFIFWQRATWWAIPPVAAIWLRLILRLPDFDQAAPPPVNVYRENISWLVLGGAIFFSVVGVSTNFVFAFDRITTTGNVYGSILLPPAWPTYPIYAVFFLGTILSTLVIIALRWRAAGAAARRLLGRIFWGNLLMILGSLSYFLTYFFIDQLPLRLAGDLLASVGLAIVGRNLIFYGGWLRHRNVRPDLRRSFALNAVLVVGFLLVFEGLHRLSGADPSWLSIPILVAATVVIATFSPFLQVGLDRLILPEWETQLRAQLDHLQSQMITAADPAVALADVEKALIAAAAEARQAQKREMFAAEMERIFRHKTIFKDPELARSPLLAERVGQRQLQAIARRRQLAAAHLSTADRAQAVRDLLEAAIAEAEEQIAAGRQAAEARIPLLILRFGYLEDKTRPEVAEIIRRQTGYRLATNSRSYTVQLNEGRRLLAEILWQQEIDAAQPPAG